MAIGMLSENDWTTMEDPYVWASRTEGRYIQAYMMDDRHKHLFLDLDEEARNFLLLSITKVSGNSI